MPLKLVVLASAEQEEHDAAETKFSELILHMVLILFLLFITTYAYEGRGSSYSESRNLHNFWITQRQAVPVPFRRRT